MNSLFITDRKDLQKQLSDTSKSVGYTVHLADNIEKLKELLKTDTPDLVMGMIHKFQERDLQKEFPMLNKSPNIPIMIDEAHRTQYKYLGANLRKALPNAVKVAYTGTPIEKTEMTFGDCIDKYSIRQAKDDGVTVEIVYEGRVHSAELTDEEKANAKFEDVFVLVDKDEQKKIMGKYTWKAYLEAEEVIKEKARDMVEHYVKHVFPNGFKAQVVAVSRLAAIRYKKALEEALKEKISELEKNNPEHIDIELLKRVKAGVVISGEPNDEPVYRPYTNPAEHEKIIKSFKLPFNAKDESGISGDVGFLVVKSMLITGFDAPIEQVMYLDTVIKAHNLLQAIARVNRVYKNKSCGFVVDYVGVLKHLKEALSIYADEDIEEITSVVKNKSKSIDELRHTHSLIDKFFRDNRIENWREAIDDCIDLLVDEKVRDEFITLARRFIKAMDIVLPDPSALKYATDLKILSFIKESARNRYRDDKLSIKDASKRVREIVEEFLISNGINPKIPPTPLLESEFIKKIENKTSREKAQTLEHAIKEHIIKHFEEDPEFYERFSDRLKAVLEQYKENWNELAQELEQIRNDIKAGREGEQNFGFHPKKEMPFFGLLKREIFGKKSVNTLSNEDLDFLITLTKDVLEIIEANTKVIDFWENYNKQKQLKSFIIARFLDKLPKKIDTSAVTEKPEIYHTRETSSILQKRNEIAQKIMELAYHIYGKG